MKTRSLIEVNLEELDQIIDRATDAPLSKADSAKLKSALHAMAERLSRIAAPRRRAWCLTKQ
jgi:hypothetical protein